MKITKWILGIAGVPLLYLSSIILWSSFYTEEFIAHYRDIQNVEFNDRQKEILFLVDDPTFQSHPGVDLSNGQGLTTITSSTVPNGYYKNHKLGGLAGALQGVYSSFFNCCKSIDIGRDLVAIVLNAQTAKEEQLQLYQKSVYMGRHRGKPVYGFSNASEMYDGKPTSELSELELIGLVAMTIAPNKYHPVRNPESHKLRVSRISKLVSGECVPNGWLDLEYEQCGL